MDNEKEIEFSLNGIFRVLKQGLWIIVITAVVFAIAAFGFSSFFVQKVYTSSVKLYVETTKAGDGSYGDLSSYNYATSLVNTYIEMLQTNNFYEKVAADLDNRYTSAQIRSMVSFNNESKTEVFTASIKASSPTEAKVVADSVAGVAPGIISTLEDNAKLKIVDNAAIPSKPASPNVSLITIVAFVLGVVLSVVFLFVREATDVKIKYDSDLLEIDGITVLSAIPDFHGGATNITALFAPEQASAAESEGK